MTLGHGSAEHHDDRAEQHPRPAARGTNGQHEVSDAGNSARQAPVGVPFIASYAIAQIGAFIAFVPVLGVILPLKAEGVAPQNAAVLASQAAMFGALAAAIAHIMAGMLSDRTRSRLGRRTPWIFFGAGLTVLSYGGVFLARTGTELVASIVVFQVCFNIMFAPLSSIFADRVPDRQKGLVSAFVGLAYPAASLFAALVIAVALTETGGRLLAVAAVVVLLVLPTTLFGLREGRGPDVAAQPLTHPLAAFGVPDFMRAFGSRLLVQTAIALNALYLLFYLQKHTDVLSALPGTGIAAILGVFIAVSTTAALVCGFAAGLASDRWGERKIFVALGGLLIATGMGILALVPAWPGPLIGQLIYGCGLGIFTTADGALIAQILPNRLHVGRDLGVMNIAVTLPQVVAPLAGILLLHGLGLGLIDVFAMSAVLATAGALIVLGIRRSL